MKHGDVHDGHIALESMVEFKETLVKRMYCTGGFLGSRALLSSRRHWDGL